MAASHRLQSLSNHWHSIMDSLVHRLAVARSADNPQLMDLLEQERQQLAELYPQPKVQGWWKSLGKGLLPNFSCSELKINHYQNGSDQWWYITDPRNGQCISAASEAELRLWIAENYQGR